ncbi:sepiapterin reductase-like [Biomphalaria glabrata]|uniref:Sepiapterin reductase-like n=1 Tax=Biomphalaria glabrata TaxID=6526 RepID=A0A9W3AD73_BIOGL|nr:sepiapterin reductase-like [Biomphalaria glabrata]XP_013094640.2 sepiapterin reductase-like [Biomphalaria glabrata]XP_055885074.1 sepiapterin reductase-like [Biomphalaria glabrata]XP_055885088.1 sepiapterin reductase-like [Biomphalaria glabrata]KAI8792811.1 sepiapterin reductase [Biomphalaria glabrata]
MSEPLLDKVSVCVITGPTRGLGRSIAQQFANKLPKGSLFILLSRNQILLDSISELILLKDGIRTVTGIFDQGSCDQNLYDNILEDCLKNAEADVTEFQQAILINNSGTLEPLDFVRNLDDVCTISNFFNTNLAGCVALTSKFMQLFNSPSIKSKIIVNISSLSAVQPMKSWALYCMAKSARDMMIKVISEEEENIRTLNYAPGPLVTDMTNIACQNTKDMELRNWFEEQVRKKSLVECDSSALKLVSILQKNTFENGAHIDYYDEI